MYLNIFIFTTDVPFLQYQRLIPEYSQSKCSINPVKNKLISII